jgi:hypothetical protein
LIPRLESSRSKDHVDTAAPSGTVRNGAETAELVINADGNWSLAADSRKKEGHGAF